MNQKIKGFLFVIITLFLIFLTLSFSCWAQLEQNEQPERDFLIYSQFSNLILEEGQSIDLDIKFINLGKQPENILVELISDAGAEGWKVLLRNESWKGFKVRQVNLLPEEPDNIKTLNLHIEAPKEIMEEQKEYTFTVKGETIDGRLSKSLDIIVAVTKKVEEEAAEEETNEILLSTKYPTMEAAAGNAMKYEIEVKNQTDEDQVIDFSVELPQGWRASISPRWMEEEKISAIKINKAGTETILLAVTPPFTAEKDEYELKLIARAGELVKSLDLKAVVTGTYTLNLGTETGNLKLSTISGEEKEFTFYIWNEGSAPIDNIAFYSSVPQGWEVKFNPERITELPSIVETQQPEKITMTIKVPHNTVPGDYMVTVNASGTQDQKKVEFRTTVQVPTKWGWIGILIIIVILAILLGIFLKLRRR
jgi:uncharacterized membrane protein